MGKLGDRAREKSPFVKIEVGGKSQELIYKAWKEITNSFGQESFRYIFETETPTGLITKNFDNPSNRLALDFDKIPFGTRIILHRKPMIDSAGAEVEGKTFYEIEEVGKGKIKTEDLSNLPDAEWPEGGE